MTESLHDRALRYLPFTQDHLLGLGRWGLKNEAVSFLSDTENIVFKANTADLDYCVRISPAGGRSVSEIMGELAWLSALRQDTDLIVPRPVPAVSGEFVLDATVDGRDYQVVLFEWLDGNVIADRLERRSTRLLGQSMARLHNHSAVFRLPTGTSREDDDWVGMGDLFVGLPALQISQMERFLTTEQIDLCQLAARRSAELISTVDDRESFGLIHSDLHARNALMDDNGRVAIIDFDDCQIAPFSCDLAISISSFASVPEKELLETAFLQGYAEKRPLPPNHLAEIEAFCLERRLRLLRWVGNWPHVDHFPNGRQIIRNSLAYIQQFEICS